MQIMGSSHSDLNNVMIISSSECTDSDSTSSDDYKSIESDMEIVTDAACSKPSIRCPSIKEIDRIDAELDDYEKVSICYLLYEDVNKACTVLNSSLENLVRDWKDSEGQRADDNKLNWKLFEALAIVKRYDLLKAMGYPKTYITMTFLPTSIYTSIHILPVRKALFCMFENLFQNQVNSLISAIQSDLSKKFINCELNKDNLELTFLNLEKVGYMSLRNLENVYRAFKSADLLTEYEQLKSIDDKLKANSDSNRVCSPLPSISPPSYLYNDNMSRINTKPIAAAVPTDRKEHLKDTADRYPIDPQKPGLLLIINNDKFYSEFRPEYKNLRSQGPKLENRDGTKVDRDRLKEAFSKLGFQVVIEENVVHEKFISVIKGVVNEVGKEKISSIFVAVLSHGDKDVIYGCNSIPVGISDIQDALCMPSLSGKPKVLLIQACQGDKIQEIDDGYRADNNKPMPVSSPPTLSTPRTADVLVFYATIPNFVAIRHVRNGTWFIQSLCDEIDKSGKTDHFMDLCTKVKQDVVNKRWVNKVMVPLSTSTLTKKLYLCVTNQGFGSLSESRC